MATKAETLRKIKEAIEAIEEYKKMPRTYRESVDDQIEDGATILIEKAHMLGSSGRTCPTCNGSGRV